MRENRREKRGKNKTIPGRLRTAEAEEIVESRSREEVKNREDQRKKKEKKIIEPYLGRSVGESRCREEGSTTAGRSEKKSAQQQKRERREGLNGGQQQKTGREERV